MLPEKKGKVEINSFDVLIKNRAPHETEEYIASRIKQATREVLIKLKEQKEIKRYLNNGNEGVYPIFNTQIGSFPLQIPNISLASSQGINNWNPKLLNLGKESSMLNAYKGFEHFREQFQLDSLGRNANTEKVNNFSFFVESDKKLIREKLIEKLENKINQRVAEITKNITPFKRKNANNSIISGDNRKSTDATINRLEYLISLLKDPSTSLNEVISNNEDLFKIYQEIIRNNEIKHLSQPNRNKLRKEIINETELRTKLADIIEEKYISQKIKKRLNKKQSKEERTKKNYWSNVKRLLQDEDVQLLDVFSEHEALFLLIETVEFKKYTELLKLDGYKEVYTKFKTSDYYNIPTGKDIYAYMSSLRKGKGPGVLKINVKEVQKESTGTQFLFKVARYSGGNKNITEVQKQKVNWIIYTKEGDIIQFYLDKGPTFTKVFGKPGDYVVEAYGSYPDFKPGVRADKRTRNKAYRLITVKAIVGIHVGDRKNGFRIRNSESISFIAWGDIPSLDPSKIKWVQSFKKKESTEFGKGTILPNSNPFKHQYLKNGWYKMEVCYEDGDYKEKKAIEFSVGNNFVTSVKQIKGEGNVLLNTHHSLSFTSEYKIKPIKEELKETKWVVLTENGASVHIPEDCTLQMTEGNDPYVATGAFFNPKFRKEGTYKILSYINTLAETKNDYKTIKVVHPYVENACWKDEYGKVKKQAGLTSKDNYITAKISNFENKAIGIHLYVDGKRITDQHFNAKTDASGRVMYRLELDEKYTKQLALGTKDTTALSFSFVGVVEDKLLGRSIYEFKKTIFDRQKRSLQITTKEKITNAYFRYNGRLVTQEDKIPYGAEVEAIVQTINMAGKKVSVNVYKKKKGADFLMCAGTATIGKDGRAIRKIQLNWYHKEYDQENTFYIASEEIEGRNWIKWDDAVFKDNYLKATHEKNIVKASIKKTTFSWAQSEFANLIATKESFNDYNICNKIVKNKVKIVRNVKVVNLTIKEIQKKQGRRTIFAVGRYQIIPNTLKDAINKLNLDVNMKFDKKMQDYIFNEYLIKIKKPKIINYLEGKGSLDKAAYSIAQEWASVGVEKGRKISKDRIAKGGESYYAGDGLNKAHITPSEIRKALIASKNSKLTIEVKGFNINNAIETLNKNAKSKAIGYCALYVRYSIDAGGITGLRGHAYQYYHNDKLKSKGFKLVGTNIDKIKVKKGDIAVFKEQYGHQYGHIQMYNGVQWVSDFRQKTFWVSEIYKVKKEYKIFRWE